MQRDYLAHTSVRDVAIELADAIREVTGRAELKLAILAVELIARLMKLGRRRVAILLDDVFQAIGIERAAMYVKSLLGLIEYPPADYEKIVVVVAASEGVSRREVGRHRWACLRPMWNMSRESFRKLYDQIPGEKLEFEEVWELTGGNPGMLARLYAYRWDTARLIEDVIREKQLESLIVSLSSEERELLYRAIKNPDVLMTREGMPLLERLVELNLVVHELHERDTRFWLDVPPPETDLKLGVGRRVAWQTPLYREAVRKVLERLS